MMNLASALKVVYSLAQASKMPCQSWSIPAKYCQTGMKLRNVVGTVCEKCYALKGRYPFPNVQNALQKRFDGFKDALWVEAMTVAIGQTESSGFFRWFDSGDLQSVDMLEKIVQVAHNLPQIQFWLPTREYAFVGEYVRKHGAFPSNLTVRLSAYMIEGKPPVELAKRYGAVASGVSKAGFTCPSSSQGNKCLTCRACWNKEVAVVSYKQH